jgi:exodeoxyribonuclease-3
MTKIVTWNVNSINARLPNVIDWLEHNQPDIVLLQETKTLEENFPFEPIEDLGYNIAVLGQKSYNGVAILSKSPFDEVIKGLPGDENDAQARYIEAVIGNVRVASIYVPNGRALDSEHFEYKMKFFDRLKNHAEELLKYEEAFVLGGDYNVAPEDADVYDPKAWKDKLHCSVPERNKVRALCNIGLTDANRTLHPASTSQGQEMYSWWDYRRGAWQENRGLRIDLLLLSPQAADRLDAAGIDTEPRGLPKASDHTPVWCQLVA